MEEIRWLNVCYPGHCQINSDGCVSWIVGGIDEGISFPFRLPKKLSFVGLYDKLIEKLQIDSNLYEMVLRCPNPFSTKSPPFVIKDDETVDWLMSNCQKTCLYVNSKLKANDIGGTNRRVMPVQNGGEDINCVANDNVEEDDTNWQTELFMNDNVESQLVGVSESVGVDEGVGVVVGVGIDVSGTLLASLDDSCLIPHIDTTLETENMIVGDMDSLSKGLNDIEPTGATQGDNVIPSSSDILPVSLWRIPDDEDLHIGDEFPTKDALIFRLKELAVAFHFEFKTGYSNKKRILLECCNTVCLWRLRATSMGSSSEKFAVRKYQSDHSCPLIAHKKRNKVVDSEFVCNNIQEKFQDPKRDYPPREIMNDFEAENGYKLSYTVAYNAQKKGKAFNRGKPKESFVGLPKFFHSLEVANLNTKTFIETDHENVFKYCFMALGPCISGYSSSILPVICVDGTFLTGAFRGTLLVAICQDGERHLYPLAFGVVDSENNNSWKWFFEKLKTITGDTSEVVILSDRAPSIKNGFQKVFKNARHGNCTIHLKRNLMSKYPKCKLSYLFKKAYKAYTRHEFKEFFELMCEKVKVYCEKSAKDYDFEEYLHVDEFRYWSRAHFDGLRYHAMTTNTAESFNNKILVAREFPIVALLKEIRSILQIWFAERQAEAQRMKDVLTPSMDKKLKKRYKQMREATLKAVEICRGSKYQVCVGQLSFVVDLNAHTCTCRRFDLKKFPCIHALCAAREVGRPFETLCSEYYYSSFFKTAYSESINPPLNEQEIEYPQSVLNRKVVAPNMKNERGKPATKRKKGVGEPRGSGEKRKEAQQSGEPEEQLQETINESPEHTLGLEEQPRDHGKNKLQKRKKAGETSNEPHEHVGLEEQPRESGKKKKRAKKFVSIDFLISRV